MSIGSFNIQGLMSASAQLEKLAQIMRDGREGAQLQFASEVEKNAAAAKSRVAPPSPSERAHQVEDDRAGGNQDMYEGSSSRGGDEERDEKPAGRSDDEEHFVDIIV